MSTSPAYPGAEWQRVSPAEAGMSPEGLERARLWLEEHGEGARYRAVVVRGGRLVAEWNRGVEREARQGLASAAKSVFSCMLAIAIQEGMITSADARVVDYYPEMMDVPEGEGPKPGR